jgi:hypothetical protein
MVMGSMVVASASASGADILMGILMGTRMDTPTRIFTGIKASMSSAELKLRRIRVTRRDKTPVLMMRVGIKVTIMRDRIISATPALAPLQRESFSRGYSDWFHR